MNLLAPISSIMTKNVIAINPDDNLVMIGDIFKNNKIHHIPVVRHKTLLGMISKHDFDLYMKGLSSRYDGEFQRQIVPQAIMESSKVKDFMTEHLAKVESTDRINVAVEVFKLNRFHALPVVDDGELVGIVTVHDIINTLAKD
jgi:acetoin utilization protein AcuB